MGMENGHSNGTNGGAGLVETRLYINGKYVESSDKKTFTLYSPATHEPVAEVSEATVDDTNAAVAAAKAAQPGWAAMSPSERGICMHKFAQLVREATGELAVLEAKSMGRPVGTYFDSFGLAAKFDYFAETGFNVHGMSSLNTPGFVNMTWKQPFGVAAAIIPWNLPLIFFGNKVAPMLAAGNAVVLKSSEKAPLTSARIAGFAEKAGFPPGVLNVIHGHGQTSGATLSSHMDVRVLSFTGSGRTGRLIQEAAAKSNLKNVILELGGKSPAIIFDDADIEKAAHDTQYSVQFNSGQVCMANSRIYVQENIADKFVEAFKQKINNISHGDPTQGGTNHGPQADELQFNTVKKYIELGKQVGKLELGGEAIKTDKGYFIHPTVFTNTPEDAQIMKEEIFGPVVNINTFKEEDDVIKRANDTEFGLYASVYTKNIDRALRVAKALESGTVGINVTSPVVGHDMPFGGYKSSGVGREGNMNSLDNFLETKSVMIKIE